MGDFLVYEQCFKLWPSELFNILDSIHANSRLKDVEKTMDMTSAEFVDNSQVQPFKDGPRGGMWNVLVCFGNGTRMSKRVWKIREYLEIHEDGQSALKPLREMEYLNTSYIGHRHMNPVRAVYVTLEIHLTDEGCNHFKIHWLWFRGEVRTKI
uniref:Uncharacterized protein n=1 Tax=Physcomitrium patens TaxID=3218 RepID=A0A2K1KE33_PHYPA|nr:hypothetical protein PHYPA_008415 [Physcomitrium patens]